MTDKMIDFLTRRGVEEAANVQSKNLLSLKAILISKEDFDAAQQSAQQSLGKMQMIDEILKFHINEINQSLYVRSNGINNDGNDRR